MPRRPMLFPRHPLRAKLIVPDVPPVPPDPVTFTRVQVGEVGGDGPTLTLANRTLNIPWINPGGDYRDASNVQQGPTHWVTVAHAAAPRTLNISIPPALVEKLLLDNTGLFFSGGGFPQPNLASMQNATVGDRPKLTITTTVNTFICPIKYDTWMVDIATHTNEVSIRTPGIMTPDLAGVTGTVTSATLTVKHMSYGSSALFIDYLDTPELLYAPGEQHPELVVQGIANTVANDAALVSHPDVEIYINPTDLTHFATFWQWGNPSPADEAAHGTEIVAWPEYGINALRTYNGPINSQTVTGNTANNRRNLWVDRPSGIYNLLLWRMNYASAPIKLFLRYIIMLENDVGTLMPNGTYSNWQGTKLPGLHGSPRNAYPDAVDPSNWQYAGAPYGPAYPAVIQDGVYTSPEHGIPSAVHNRAMGLQLYLYHEDHPLSQFYGNGDMRYTGLVWVQNRKYSMETMVELNTPGPTGQHLGIADGKIRIWMDGVLAYSKDDIKWRAEDCQRLFSADMLIMHGGNGIPTANQHYQIGGWCVSNSYIGPPKLI